MIMKSSIKRNVIAILILLLYAAVIIATLCMTDSTAVVALVFSICVLSYALILTDKY